MKHKFSPTLKLSEGFSLYAFRKEMNEIWKMLQLLSILHEPLSEKHISAQRPGGEGGKWWAGNEEIDRVAAKEVT